MIHLRQPLSVEWRGATILQVFVHSTHNTSDDQIYLFTVFSGSGYVIVAVCMSVEEDSDL